MKNLGKNHPSKQGPFKLQRVLELDRRSRLERNLPSPLAETLASVEYWHEKRVERVDSVTFEARKCISRSYY